MNFDFWRFRFYWIFVVSDEDLKSPGYPWYKIQLPSLVKKSYGYGLCWGVLFSHSVELWFKTNLKHEVWHG